MTQSGFDRRTAMLAAMANIVCTDIGFAQTAVTHPVISEAECPLQSITPVASDGYKGLGVLRKPPGNGPFPVLISIHGGMETLPFSTLQEMASESANVTRFLAAGYVVIVPTYRSRVVDPQSTVSLRDCLAAVEYARKLPYVDPDSIVVFGCSGGGDLALEVASNTDIAAVAPEEPASVLMSGVFNASSPKKGEVFAPQDSFLMLNNPRPYYTAEFQNILQAKIAKIRCPILVIQGEIDRPPTINRWNAQVLIPELRAAGKSLEVKTYAQQLHCFCLASGLKWPYNPPPVSWPVAAAQASRDIDEFFRRHLKTQPQQIDPRLLTYVAVTIERGAGRF